MASLTVTNLFSNSSFLFSSYASTGAIPANSLVVMTVNAFGTSAALSFSGASDGFNSYTLAAQQLGTAADGRASGGIFYAFTKTAIPSGSTFSCSGANTVNSIVDIYYVQGLVNAGFALDRTGTNTASSTPSGITGFTITTSAALTSENEVAFGVSRQTVSNTGFAATGFTLQNASLPDEFGVFSGVTSISWAPTWTTAGGNTAVFATFYEEFYTVSGLGVSNIPAGSSLIDVARHDGGGVSVRTL